MRNEEIANRFERLATLMEIRDEDSFRIRAYRNAADIIRGWPIEMKDIASTEGTKGLQEIPGIGKAISGKVLELIERGTFEAWEKLTAEMPESVLELLEVSGIGMKTAATLYQRFKISSREDLAKFVEGGGLEMVDNIGEKTAEKIRKNLQQANH
jgi:DNA polymerase (family X)